MIADNSQPQILEAVFQNVPMAIVLVSPETQEIEGWNPFAAALFGHSSEDALGQSLQLIFDESTALSFTEHTGRMQGYLNSGSEARQMTFDDGRVVRGVTRSGDRPYLDIKVFPIPDAGLVGAAIADVTAQHQSNRALKDKDKQLKVELGRAQESAKQLAEDNVELLRLRQEAQVAEASADYRLTEFTGRADIIKLLLLLVAAAWFLPMIINGFNRLPAELLASYDRGLIFLLTVLSAIVTGFFGLAQGLQAGRGLGHPDTPPLPSDRRSPNGTLPGSVAKHKSGRSREPIPAGIDEKIPY